MLETRTPCLYDQSSILIRVHRIFSHVEASCTARAASLERWTRRIWPHLGKYFYFTDTYFARTDWTAISGFFYTRVCVYKCIVYHQSFIIYSVSRHIKPRNCCPICPIVEIVDKNSFLSALLSVQVFSIAVLSVQQLYLVYKSLLNVLLTPGLSGRKCCILRQSRCGSEFHRFVKAEVVLNTVHSTDSIQPGNPDAEQARSPYPPVKGPYKPLHSPRAGATPIACQLNSLKVWVNAVNGVNGLLSGVNALG